MPELIGDHNIHEYLTAFADGELDAAQNLAVLNHLKDHPESLQLMRDQQHLRLAAHRAIRLQTPPTPQALRNRVSALSIPSPTSTSGTRRAPGRVRSFAIDWRTAAAAMLLVGTIVGAVAAQFFLRPANPDPKILVERPAPSVIPITLVAAATHVHVDCSRLAQGFHSADYPPVFTDLAANVKGDVGGTDTHPDLTAIGFNFVGAGPCSKPLQNTIHLLYHSARTDSPAAVSVFVQRNSGQYPLEPGKLYTVSGPEAPFPMLAWRTPGVVYFLIADDAETVESARRAIAGAPNR